MPFANFKMPQAAPSKAKKEELVHRTTALFAEYSAKQSVHTRWCIEEVPDGGFGRADEAFVVPDAYRAKA